MTGEQRNVTIVPVGGMKEVPANQPLLIVLDLASTGSVLPSATHYCDLAPDGAKVSARRICARLLAFHQLLCTPGRECFPFASATG